MTTRTITAEELKQLHEQGQAVDLIDVRTPVEYREAHVSFARNLPLDQIDGKSRIDSPAGAASTEGNSDGSAPIYVLCQSGNRSKQACRKLESAGHDNIVNIDGGTSACIAAGLPVTRGKKAMSLERQVRIVAGSMVLIGVLLGWLAHPGFYGLSAFVGAGLVFAGITDFCGMGLLLARMPWNKVKEASCEAPTATAAAADNKTAPPQAA